MQSLATLIFGLVWWCIGLSVLLAFLVLFGCAALANSAAHGVRLRFWTMFFDCNLGAKETPEHIPRHGFDDVVVWQERT